MTKNLMEIASDKLDKLKEEYDLSDLAANDFILLNNLAEAMASLDIFNELLTTALAAEEIDVRRIKSIQDLISDVTKNITSLSGSLKIDRKSRDKKTENLPDYIKDLKIRAAKFIEQRFSYIYCPKCKTLLATLWLLKYSQGSKFKFSCPICSKSFLITDSELARRKNLTDVVVPKGQE